MSAYGAKEELRLSKLPRCDLACNVRATRPGRVKRGEAGWWRVGARSLEEAVAALLGEFEHRRLGLPFGAVRIRDGVRRRSTHGVWHLSSVHQRRGARPGDKAFVATARLVYIRDLRLMPDGHTEAAVDRCDLLIEIARKRAAVMDLFRIDSERCRSEPPVPRPERWLRAAGPLATTFEALVAMAVAVADERHRSAR